MVQDNFLQVEEFVNDTSETAYEKLVNQLLASPKYGNIAIQKLIEKMLRLGSAQHNLEAKIFGGAAVIGNRQNPFNIGKKNCNIALKMLDEANIPITAQSIGGANGRKLKFNTSTGIVLMKQVKK